MLLHAWGGVCLKAAVDASNLFVNRGAMDVEQALTAARGAGVLAVVLLVFGYYLSYRLVVAIDSSALPVKRKNIIIGLLPLAYLVAVSPLAMLLDLFA
jgi:hypothetical protein